MEPTPASYRADPPAATPCPECKSGAPVEVVIYVALWGRTTGLPLVFPRCGACYAAGSTFDPLGGALRSWEPEVLS